LPQPLLVSISLGPHNGLCPSVSSVGLCVYVCVCVRACVRARVCVHSVCMSLYTNYTLVIVAVEHHKLCHR